MAGRTQQGIYLSGCLAPPTERKAGEELTIDELRKRNDLLHELYRRLERQKLLLDSLHLAYQKLWNDSEMQARCFVLQGEVAREVVKTSRQVLDLSDGKPIAEVLAVGSDQEARDETLPW